MVNKRKIAVVFKECARARSREVLCSILRETEVSGDADVSAQYHPV
jgi:hypothetical protein